MSSQECIEINDNSADEEKSSESKYTNEQKIVAAVWMHEKSFNNQTLEDIKNNFKIRFKSQPPKTEVLNMWENQLFTLGEIKADGQSDDEDNEGEGEKDNFNVDDLSEEGTSEEENSD